jgi:hypothetical protein
MSSLREQFPEVPRNFGLQECHPKYPGMHTVLKNELYLSMIHNMASGESWFEASRANSSLNPVSKKTFTKKDWWSGSGCGP